MTTIENDLMPAPGASIVDWQHDADELCRQYQLRCRPNFVEDENKIELDATSLFNKVTISSGLIQKAGAYRQAIIAHELGHITEGHSTVTLVNWVLCFFILPFLFFSRERPLAEFIASIVAPFLLYYAVTAILEIRADAYAVRLIGREKVKELLKWIRSPETDFKKDLKVKLRLKALR